jgi:stage III sporulation protein AC
MGGKLQMEIALLMKAVGIGLLVSVSVMLLNKSGRDEQGVLMMLTGIIVVMLMVAKQIGVLFDTLREIFGI